MEGQSQPPKPSESVNLQGPQWGILTKSMARGSSPSIMTHVTGLAWRTAC